MSRIQDIEVVEDRTPHSRPDVGFLRLRRLRLRNLYEDGTTSEAYDCDVVSRRYVDAVAVVVYDRDPKGKVLVALRTGVRPAIVLRRGLDLPHEERSYLELAEIVAGVLEDEDAETGGVEKRAAAECEEEAGYRVAPRDIRPLGAPLYPSPGVTDERVLFRVVQHELADRVEACGDGSAMERDVALVVLPLREAIERCRTGDIPDMKTEVALLRLADELGYIPALDKFVDDLPKYLQKRHRRLGMG